jgi:hypothetical protein
VSDYGLSQSRRKLMQIDVFQSTFQGVVDAVPPLGKWPGESSGNFAVRLRQRAKASCNAFDTCQSFIPRRTSTSTNSGCVLQVRLDGRAAPIAATGTTSVAVMV